MVFFYHQRSAVLALLLAGVLTLGEAGSLPAFSASLQELAGGRDSRRAPDGKAEGAKLILVPRVPFYRPDSGLPERRNRRSGSPEGTRDGGRKAQAVAPLQLDRVVQACLYRDGRWLLPGQDEYPAGQALGGLAPSFVTGAIRVTAGVAPDRNTRVNWAGLRRAVRRGAPGAAFDIVLDLRQYRHARELQAHMARVGEALEAEAWTLLGAAAVVRARPELLRAAVAEARRQGRRVGAFAAFRMPELRDMDYLLAVLGRSSAFAPEKGVPEGSAPAVPVILLAADPEIPSGSAFARGKTPAERRLMVIAASKAQAAGLRFAHPLFGPMATEDRAYNALRDEFMLDTLRRVLAHRREKQRP